MTHQYVNYTFIDNALNPYLLGWFYRERGDIDAHACFVICGKLPACYRKELWCLSSLHL